ncbi:MAG: Eco57I restriction-modification methylase domain-containing protein, partial [Polyangiales bacterium]
PMPRDPDERMILAMRVVADRCLYGVDKNPMAVEMGKLSLWLSTLQKDRPFTFVDHALRCGDSLFGLVSVEQVETLHFAPRTGATAGVLGSDHVRTALKTALAKREQLEHFSVNDIGDAQRKASLLTEAEAAIAELKIAADVVVGLAMAEARDGGDFDKARSGVALRVGAAFKSKADTRQAAFDVLASEARYNLAPGGVQLGTARSFHWVLEFPEVFCTEPVGFDAIIGNPPFMGGRRMPEQLGVAYSNAVRTTLGPVVDAVDLVAFFFRRAAQIGQRASSIGLVATKTISETATRRASLDYLESRGFTFYRANSAMQWPGDATVTVALILAHRGPWLGEYWLDGAKVTGIDSSLGALGTLVEPHRLQTTIRYSQGTNIFGRAFVLDGSSVEFWCKRCPGLRRYLRRYVNGDVFGATPNATSELWAVDFGARDEHELADCKELVAYLTKAVGAERANQTRQIHESRPWLFWDKRDSFYAVARALPRVIGCVSPTRHLAFLFLNPEHVFDVGIRLFASPDAAVLAVLQSSIHAAWAYGTSSKMGNSLRYLTSASFDTFVFPEQNAALRAVGEAYDEERSSLMRSLDSGPTKLYGRFHDPTEVSREFQMFRARHAELDRAVAAAYGWNEPDLAHGFVETKQGVRFTISEAARRAVLTKLGALNQRRYAEECAHGEAGVPNRRAHDRDDDGHHDVEDRVNADLPRPQLKLFETPLALRSAVPLGTAAKTVLEAIKRAGGAIGKSEILAKARINDAEWGPAIVALKEARLVVQEGEKRGARYRAVT